MPRILPSRLGAYFNNSCTLTTVSESKRYCGQGGLGTVSSLPSSMLRGSTTKVPYVQHSQSSWPVFTVHQLTNENNWLVLDRIKWSGKYVRRKRPSRDGFCSKLTYTVCSTTGDGRPPFTSSTEATGSYRCWQWRPFSSRKYTRSDAKRRNHGLGSEIDHRHRIRIQSVPDSEFGVFEPADEE